MSAPSPPGVFDADADPLDASYAFVAGLYAAFALAPLAVLLAALWVTDPAVLYVGFFAALAAATGAVGWIVRRLPGLAVSLGRHDAVRLLAVVAPVGWFVGVFGALEAGVALPGVAPPLGLVGTLGGMFSGVAVVTMSRTRYANAATAGAETLAEWDARWPRRWRRRAGGAVAAAAVLSVAGFAADLRFGVDGAWYAYYVLLFVFPVAAASVNSRTYRATDVGLVAERPLQREFRPWTAYDGYALTEDALVVRAAAWWRVSHRFDRSDVEDVEAVVDALDEVFGTD